MRKHDAFRGNQRSQPSGGDRGLVARTIVLSQECTTVFRGAPSVAGPAAVLLGNIDNDPKGEVEIAVGGLDGRLAIFKGGHFTGTPFLVASGIQSYFLGFQLLMLPSCRAIGAPAC